MTATESSADPSQGQPPEKATAGRLFLAFLRLGLTAFGGPAMVAYIRDLAVRKKQWLTREVFEDGAALCQSIPGATAMQTAAYVGLRAAGPAGALAAFAGFVLPAFALMIALSAAYQAGRGLTPVLSAFKGLNIIIIAIIANAALSFGIQSVRNWRDLILTAAAAVLLFLHISPIAVIAGSAATGMLLYLAADSPKPDRPNPTGGSIRHLRWRLAMIVAIAAAGTAALFFMDKKLFSLSLIMMKIDLFAFGGGFASVPLMLHEIVDVRGWLDQKTFMDGIALGQVTPGPIVITATFVGYHIGGLAGAAVATVAIFTPSFFMVLLTVPYLDRLKKWRLFQRALRGVLASFVGLLAAVAAAFGLAITWWSAPATILGAACFAALLLKVDILWVVLAGTAISVVIL
ncbi:MAG: chromate efflux transporter [Planctomycetes bacterium]|nr:chromate efflux transporter [Planctomycetota bacterium]